ncbi:hypothetical protein LUZ60_010011 [Juncus effusus]|nr:hypothetical protein LUZ60_010011 [Juncus effusus]
MDSSRRAVESYWRSRLVDAVTSDEDKVAPVYKLEEICELLRVSDSGIVKEMSEFVLKRLDHKSPLVKQKALRLIKYAVAKSGTEFRREMQKHSTAVRQLVHYKGQPDPLKGDALNKAVRETANEAMAAVFSTGEAKPAAPTAASESLGKRIQGFGNTNYDPTMMRDDKRSFLTEVVEIGSASLKQGLSTFHAAHSMMKSDGYNSATGSSTGTGTYRSPNLRRSLTSEKNSDGYSDNASWQGSSKNVGGTNKWGPDSSTGTGTGLSTSGTSDETGTVTGTGRTGVKTREERLLETVVTTGGVRLQPTRDALQLFITETAKLDAVAMSRAIETKLQSPLWQVRMKAMCVLEAILRRKEEEPYFVIASYFNENCEAVARCCDLPQVSLREKATKVLNMLDGEQTTETTRASEPSVTQTKSSPVVQLPDLIDTGDLLDDQIQSETPTNINNNNNIDDLLGSVGPISDISTSPVADISADFSNTPNSKASNGNDPFADVSFHVSEERESTKDLFSGLTTIDDNNDKSELPDIFGDISPKIVESQSSSVNDLMAGLDITGTVPAQQNDTMAGLNITTGTVPAQNGLNSLYNQGPVQFNAIPPQFMLNPAILGQQQMNMNYGAMSALIAQQQQILQNMGGFNPAFGNNNNNNFNNNSNMGFGGLEGGIGTPSGFNSPAFPDIFQTSGNNNNNAVQNHVAMMGSSKKEDKTKAFDFVSDHLAAARGPKKLI